MEITPFAAVDVGTSRIRVAVGIPREDDHIQVLGMGECISSGIMKGEVVNFDKALTVVRAALEQAEEISGASIKSAYMALTGGHFQTIVNRGSIPILDNNMEILEEDVESVVELAGTLNLPPDREKVHSICQHYFLDDHRAVVNPIGMEASKLGADVMIVHGNRSRIRNAVRLLKTVPLEVEDTPVAGLCSALAVLQPEEKVHGALVIDIGGGTTDFLGYADNTIAVAGSLGVGGDHITKDIACGLRISNDVAEALKEQRGTAIVDMTQRLQRLDLPEGAGPEGRVVRIGDLHAITSVRIDEMLAMVKVQVEKDDLLQRFGSGIIFTGGTAHLPRLTDLAEKIFGVACRIGKARDISGLTSASTLPEYATVLGLLRFASRTSRRRENGNGLMGWFSRIWKVST
ncbi:MAG TPA: cell division protein FtsA [Kiritimatiellia bacterium]|nr:cell division protein FtsA [Kiritimatiellia bacterium]